MNLPRRTKNDGDYGNDIIIRGNIGRDAEMSYGTDGQAMTKFSVAVWGGKGKTMWLNCTAWEDLAEACAEELVRQPDGKMPYVEVKGYLSENEWKDKKYFTLTAKHVAILERQPAVIVTEESTSSGAPY